jgi:membrane protein
MLWSRFAVPIGWREVLRRTGAAIYRDDCFGWSAELAYYFFFALFPALLFLVTLVPYVPVQHLPDALAAALSRVAPVEVVNMAREQLNQLASHSHTGFMTIGLLGTIWSMSSGLTAIIDTFNQAYHVREARPWWRVRLVAIALTFALLCFGLTSFVLVMTGPILAGHFASALGLGPAFALVSRLLGWPIVFFLVVTGVALVYYFAPDVQQEWIWITPGSLTATTLWLLVSLGLRWYVSHFGAYQRTYGAIGGVILALLWLYYSGLMLLFGAELNATIEHASLYGKNPGEKVPRRPLPPPRTA